MKIIKRGNKPLDELRFECKTCGCVFLASYAEYSEWIPIGGQETYKAICPCCEHAVLTIRKS